MAPKKIVDLIRNYLTVLSEEGIGIEQAFLYGSYSNDTATEDSDIDLLLVSKNIDVDDDFLIGKIWALTKRVSSKIEPYVVSESKFERDEISPLIQLVKTQGIRIFKI